MVVEPVHMGRHGWSQRTVVSPLVLLIFLDTREIEKEGSWIEGGALSPNQRDRPCRPSVQHPAMAVFELRCLGKP